MKNVFHKNMHASALAMLLLTIVLISTANATMVFVTGSNTNPNSAVSIPTNSQQWTFYDRFNSIGSAQYYSIYLTKGENVNIVLSVPTNQSSLEAYPQLAIIGPALNSAMQSSVNLYLPAGYGAIFPADSATTMLNYNPIIPSETSVLASTSFTAYQNSTYYIAVFNGQANSTYEISSTSSYVLSLGDWLTLSAKSLGIYSWEQEPLWFVFLPVVLVFVLGQIIVLKKYWGDWDRLSNFRFWISIFAAIFLFGGSLTILVQVLLYVYKTGSFSNVLISAAPILIGVLLGLLALMVPIDKETKQNSEKDLHRKRMVLIGLLGIASSSGFLAGPILAILSGIVPKRIVPISKVSTSRHVKSRAMPASRRKSRARK